MTKDERDHRSFFVENVMQTRLLERIAVLLKVNLQDLLMESADPQETVAYWRAEMEAGLADAKDAVAKAMAHERQLEKQLKAAQSSADEWDAKVDAALEASDDVRAHIALKCKMTYEGMANELRKKLDRQRQVIAEMKASVSALQQKAIALVGHARSARSGRKSS
jgi:phage shock protein A